MPNALGFAGWHALACVGMRNFGEHGDASDAMPRSPGINFPDAVYHVTSRRNGRARIFAPRAGPAKAVVVELACRPTRLSGRSAGTHYGGISPSAVSDIRRRVRQWQDGILSVMDRLAATIREAEPATVQSVK